MASVSSWKQRPCHFTWDLRTEVLTDYERIVKDLDSRLDSTPNLQRVENLLFRAYLEVWDSRKHWDVQKAKKFLTEADECISGLTDPHLQNGYKSVALLNRLWIDDRSHKKQEVERLHNDLDDLQLGDEEQGVLDAVKATALIRLGPRFLETSRLLFVATLQQFPDDSNFLFGAAFMTKRRLKQVTAPEDSYKDMGKPKQDLVDEERKYWEKMMKVKDEYQLAKSNLGLSLCRRRGCDGTEEKQGRKMLEEAYKENPGLHDVCRNLAKYYRDNGMFGKADKILEHDIQNDPLSAESPYQLALCYIRQAKDARKAKNQQELTKWNEKALEYVRECLKRNKWHRYAGVDEAKILTHLKRPDEAMKVYEDMLQRSEHYTDEDKLNLYINYARFLEKDTSASDSDRCGIWNKIMDTAAALEYQDKETGEWQVPSAQQWIRKEAFKKLIKCYQQASPENVLLQCGILHYKHCCFDLATEELEQLDKQTNPTAVFYLARSYRKWGLQKTVQARKGQCESGEAIACLMKARENVQLATELGFNPVERRELLADTVLAIAHNQLHTAEGIQNQSAAAGDSVVQQNSTPAGINLEAPCIQSYREAVRCGSLVASIELLRLIQKDCIQVTSRWQLLRILAEIDTCCSQNVGDRLHRHDRPLSFKNGRTDLNTDDAPSALPMICQAIRQDIVALVRRDGFFRQAWKEHFTMERQILQERFQNNDGELELDGREEEGSTVGASDEIQYAAVDCCEKLHPLLDHVIGKFQKEQLNITDKVKQYFPLIPGATENSSAIEKEQSKDATTKRLQEILKDYLEIGMENCYPKLFTKLLSVQPGYNSQNEYLLLLRGIVNTVKHSSTELTEIHDKIGNGPDLVKLARQSTDKVEEICCFFVDAMKEVKDLEETVKQLVSDIRDGQHQKADKLIEVLSHNHDFGVRMGSTWKFLEMMAVVRLGREQSGANEAQAESEMVEGNFPFSQKLRRRHLAVELTVLKTSPRSQDVLGRCSCTCREADQALRAICDLYKKKMAPSGQAVATATAFPFRDMHPGNERLKVDGATHWKGKVKKQLNKDLNNTGIPGCVKDKLLAVILQAQPCTDESNYHFFALQEFLKQPDGGVIPDSVSIKTDNSEEKTFQVLDLTRWCVDNTERITTNMYALIHSN